MTRPLRVGDRVTATGIVRGSLSGLYVIKFDGDVMTRSGFASDALTLIAPAEPPVGSVVVKDGVAYHTIGNGKWHAHHTGNGKWLDWDDISDGEILFTPEAPDVG